MFLGQHCWHAIRIAGGKLHQIQYIALPNAPVSTVRHYAPVKSIEPYGEERRSRLVFAELAEPVGPVRQRSIGSDARPALRNHGEAVVGQKAGKPILTPALERCRLLAPQSDRGSGCWCGIPGCFG